MKTHAILFDNSKYKCNIDSLESIYMVTDYILKPYKDIGIFSFNNFLDVPYPIIGQKDKETMLKEIIQWSNIRKEKIFRSQTKKYIVCDKSFDNIEIINLFKLLCGVYEYEMQFYNDISKDSTLTDICYNNISENYENFVLSFTNLYL